MEKERGRRSRAWEIKASGIGTIGTGTGTAITIITIIIAR
jgi:hypothetical protein